MMRGGGPDRLPVPGRRIWSERSAPWPSPATSTLGGHCDRSAVTIASRLPVVPLPGSLDRVVSCGHLRHPGVALAGSPASPARSSDSAWLGPALGLCGPAGKRTRRACPGREKGADSTRPMAARPVSEHRCIVPPSNNRRPVTGTPYGTWVPAPEPSRRTSNVPSADVAAPSARAAIAPEERKVS
jgi:hypothetical protein